MKFIVLAMTLVFSISAFAKTPATQAFKNLITSGEHEGHNGSEKCTVTVTTYTDSVTVAIKAANSYNAFAILDSALNYHVNETTGEISATQSLNYPRYLQGGTTILNVRANDNNQVQFYISNILLDHRGNDASTYAACTITL